jgi:CO/xanthine dehydrogenase FAD-binding subunit
MTMLEPGPAASGSTRPGSMSPSARLLRPGSLDEALEMLAQPDTAVLGGGVGHLLRRHEHGPAAALVAVGPLAELGAVEWSADHVSIGAGVRLSRIEADSRLAEIWPLVTRAAGSVATARIRRLVTLGGNIAACDDSHDPPVALAAAGAQLVVCGPESTRILPAASIGVLALALRPGEVIREVRLPIPVGRVGSAFEKFLVRGVWEYACVNVGAVVRLGEDGTVRELSLAVGSVAAGPVLVAFADLVGERLDDAPSKAAVLDEIGRRAAAATEPYSDVRGSARYKSQMIAEFARRAVAAALGRAEERGTQ